MELLLSICLAADGRSLSFLGVGRSIGLGLLAGRSLPRLATREHPECRLSCDEAPRRPLRC